MAVCMSVFDRYLYYVWNNLKHTENNVEIIRDNRGINAPKLCENWPLTLQ